MNFNFKALRATTFMLLTTAGLIVGITGCGGGGGNGLFGGSSGGSGGGTGANKSYNGFYKGVLAQKKQNIRAAKIGDAVSFQFNGTSGTALFTRTSPELLSYDATITNIALNSTTGAFSFSLTNFTGEYSSATFSGTATFNSAGQVTSATGNFGAKLLDGTTETDSLGITFQAGVPLSDFTGHWTGKLTASALGQPSADYSFVGDYTQTGDGTLTAHIVYTDPKSGTPYAGDLKGLAAGNTYAGTDTETVPPYGTANGSFIGHLNPDGSMSGDVNVKKDFNGIPITVVTGTFTATRAVVQQNNEALQFANATQQTSNGTLSASAGTTSMGDNIRQGSIGAAVQVPSGSSVVRVYSGTSNVFSQSFAFDKAYRAVFVALDDVNSSSVQMSQVIYNLSNALPSGNGSISVAEGINTDMNHLGSKVDFYVYPSSQNTPTSPTVSGLDYSGNYTFTGAAGQYTIVASSAGVPPAQGGSIAQTSSPITLSAGQRLIAVLVSPPNVQARFEVFTVAGF